MFEITLVEHLRLTFAHIVASHREHAEAARVHARRSRLLKGGEALLVAATAVAATGAASGWGQGGVIAAAICAALALIVLVADLILNLDRSAQAHAHSAVQYWSMRERYRALLADLNDRVLRPEEARAARNALLEELRQVHEAAPLGSVHGSDEAADAAAPANQSMLVASTEH